MGHGDYFEYAYSYEGNADGRVRFKTVGGHYSPSGDDTRDISFECTQPPDSLAPGAEVTLAVRIYTENVVLFPPDSYEEYRTEVAQVAVLRERENLLPDH